MKKLCVGLMNMLQSLVCCRLNREIFLTCFAELKKIFAGQVRGERIDFNDSFVESYYNSVCHLPDDIFLLAVKKVKQSYGKISGFPLPQDIINSAKEILGEVAEMQWYKLIDAMSLPGYGIYVEKFKADPLTMFILHRYFGGWVGFCNMLENEVEKKKRLFIEKFIYHAMNPDTIEEIPYLEGLASDGKVLELDKVVEEKRRLREKVLKSISKSKKYKQIEAPSVSPEERKENLNKLKDLIEKTDIAKPMPEVVGE